MENTTINHKFLAENLLRLAKDYKEKCGGHGDISLQAVGRFYKELMGRRLTDEEFEAFY